MSSIFALPTAAVMLRRFLTFGKPKPGRSDPSHVASSPAADATVPQQHQPASSAAAAAVADDDAHMDTEVELANYDEYVPGVLDDDSDADVPDGEYLMDEPEDDDDIVLTPLDRYVKTAPTTAPVNRAAMLPPRLPKDEGRLTVVLDMDETLLHAMVEPISAFAQEVPEHMPTQDFECGFKYGEEYFSARVWLRPGVQRFLEELDKICEPVIFTAGSRDYASPVLDTADGKRIIRSRLYREAVVSMPTYSYVKDLSQLGRPLDRTIIIDNTPRVFALHPFNGIVIKDFHGDDQTCTALDQVLEVVRDMVARHDEDVRDMVRELPIFHQNRAFGRVPDPVM